MLSGFAKDTAEKSNAEDVEWEGNGVELVKNQIAVRP